MSSFVSSMGLALLEWFLCLCGLICLKARDTDRKFTFPILLLASRLSFTTILIPILAFAGHEIKTSIAYKVYFYIYWLGFAMEAVLSLFVIYSLFNLAMAPLGGIKAMGEIVFRWAAAVSVALTMAVLFVPHANGTDYVTGILTELQRAQGMLTLSLLLFVCFAIRPLGLTYRSRPFGVILGLGLLATANLVSSGWLAYSEQMYSVVNDVKSMATSAALLLWVVYFMLPEPKRSIVVLPTTSPYLQWNMVAQALGDPPGFVAIAGVPPELFAAAELEVMRRASLQMASVPYSRLDRSNIA